VLVPWDPSSTKPEFDGSDERELEDIQRYYLVIDEPARGPKVDVNAPQKSKKIKVKATQEIDDELAACFPPCGPIYEYMHWAVRCTHTPPQFHLAAILPLLSFEACRRNYVSEAGTPLHLWSGIIAPPAIGKTTAVGYAQDFTKDFYDAIQKGGLKPWVTLEGSLPGVVEDLAQRLDDQHDITPAILYHSELSRVLRADDASELLCMLYDTRDVERNLRYLQKRKDKGEDVKTAVKAPRISAVVTSTLSAMQQVFKPQMLFGGLASRLLWFYTSAVDPSKLMAKELVDQKARARALEAWRGWVGIMDSFTVMRAARRVTLTIEAEEMLESFYDDNLREIIADPANELASIAQRANIVALRIAALYAMSIGQLGIDADCAQRAINLIRRSLKQSEILMPQLSETPFGRAMATILAAVQAAGKAGLSRRDVYKLVRGQSKAFLDQIRDTLVDGGMIVELTLPAQGRGRPPVMMYVPEHAPVLPPTLIQPAGYTRN